MIDENNHPDRELREILARLGHMYPDSLLINRAYTIAQDSFIVPKHDSLFEPTDCGFTKDQNKEESEWYKDVGDWRYRICLVSDWDGSQEMWIFGLKDFGSDAFIFPRWPGHGLGVLILQSVGIPV